MSQPLIVETEKDDAGIARITMKGFLAGYDVYCAKKAVTEAVQEGCPAIILDLREVEYMDSQGIGALSGMVDEVKKTGIKIVAVRSRNSRVGRVLEHTAMDKIIQFYGAVEEAIGSLRFLLGLTEITKHESEEEGLVAKVRSLSQLVATLEQRIEALESRVG